MWLGNVVLVDGPLTVDRTAVVAVSALRGSYHDWRCEVGRAWRRLSRRR